MDESTYLLCFEAATRLGDSLDTFGRGVIKIRHRKIALDP